LKKIAAYLSEIRFDPNISDLDASFLSFFIPLIMTLFVVYPRQNKILLMNMELQQFIILNKTKTTENHTLRVKSHSACENSTLRVEINLIRVEIELVRVGVTFVPVEFTLRVEIKLYV
jgi:hypothetical protein